MKVRGRKDIVQCVSSVLFFYYFISFYFLGKKKTSLFYQIDQFYLILLFFCLSFLSTRKFNTPTDFVVEFVRFLCFKSDFIWLLIFFFWVVQELTQPKKTHAAGIRNVRHRQGRDPAIYRMRERSDHMQPKTDTLFFYPCCLSVCCCFFLFYFILLFFYRRKYRGRIFLVLSFLLQLFPFISVFLFLKS